MQRFRNILVVVEEESLHHAAMARALRLAQENGARLTVLDYTSHSQGELERLLALVAGQCAGDAERQMAHHLDRAETMAQAAREAGIEADAAVASGTPFIEIIEKVLRDSHDLVLKGQHTGASGFAGAIRGPDLQLIRKCPVPVWIVKDDAATRTRAILACVDPDADPDDTTRAELNRTVLQLALSLAERDGASVDILGVWRVQAEGALRSGRFELVPGEVDRVVEHERLESLGRLEKMAAEFADAPVRKTVLHLKGVPGDVIPGHAASAGIDTIVMGTLGRTGIPGLFIGNTAETILGRVSCAVLTVKPAGFVSPVEPDRAA